ARRAGEGDGRGDDQDKEGEPGKNAHARSIQLRPALVGRDAEVPEMGLGGDGAPQADLAVRDAVFQVVDDQHRLRAAVHEQTRLHAADLDLNVRPGAGDQIDVRLVDARSFRAQALPR